jgi:hypothetical protein
MGSQPWHHLDKGFQFLALSGVATGRHRESVEALPEEWWNEISHSWE